MYLRMYRQIAVFVDFKLFFVKNGQGFRGLKVYSKLWKSLSRWLLVKRNSWIQVQVASNHLDSVKSEEFVRLLAQSHAV